MEKVRFFFYFFFFSFCNVKNPTLYDFMGSPFRGFVLWVFFGDGKVRWVFNFGFWVFCVCGFSQCKRWRWVFMVLEHRRE